MNMDTNIRHGHWRVGAYVKNLADRRVPMVPSVVPEYLSGGAQALATTELINPPREIGLRAGYQF
jgi:outer membrane receptor protein involved in Fe transport